MRTPARWPSVTILWVKTRHIVKTPIFYYVLVKILHFSTEIPNKFPTKNASCPTEVLRFRRSYNSCVSSHWIWMLFDEHRYHWTFLYEIESYTGWLQVVCVKVTARRVRKGCLWTEWKENGKRANPTREQEEKYDILGVWSVHTHIAVTSLRLKQISILNRWMPNWLCFSLFTVFIWFSCFCIFSGPNVNEVQDVNANGKIDSETKTNIRSMCVFNMQFGFSVGITDVVIQQPIPTSTYMEHQC